jgi:single-strand DNA-binding protein
LSINTITISGRVVRDPELRSLPSGDSVFENALAVEHYRKEGENEVSFVDWKVYGGFADLLNAKLTKGEYVTVSGYIKQESWETTEGKRSKLILVARDVTGEFQFKPSNGVSPPTETAVADQPESADDGIPF